jgi:cysteinyl-tRNA synthetase
VLRIHDTLLGRVVPFSTREDGKVAMYVCGPTVYDHPHVGHGRMNLTWDVIRRYLRWRGYDVTSVSNVTDIEDKIIGRAAERHSTETAVAAEFEAVWFEAMDRLGVARPDHVPHATDYVERMVAMIGELIERGHAYVVPDAGVYFAVETFPSYGRLPHRSTTDLLESSGARVEVDERKRSPLDFALWKAAKPGEPTWPSPWGDGRPGWHIECSVMSLDLLGEGFDLHGGGDDLVFPHHENERAQAEAAGHCFARHWAHSGMVTVDGEKMSKSLGNFTTLQDVLDAYEPRALRLLVLQTHYRKQMLMGKAELDAAVATLAGLDAHARRARAAGVKVDDVEPDAAVVAAFRDAVDDDLNTPRGLAIVHDAVRDANAAIDAGDLDRAAPLVAAVGDLLGRAFGLELDDGSGAGDDDADIEALVADRDEARRNRDWSRADALRDELAARGVRIEDTPHGTVWSR